MLSLRVIDHRSNSNRIRSRTLDHLFTYIVWGAALLVFAVFVWVLGDLAWQGVPHLSFSFLFSEPQNSGRAGGIAPILVSTLLIILIALNI